MKRITALLTAVAMLLSIGSMAADTDPDALPLAKMQVPAMAVLTSTDEDDNRLEFTFDDKVGQAMYRVALNRSPLAVVKVESRMYGKKGADKVELTQEDALKRVRELFQQAVTANAFVERDDDDGRFHFTVVFRPGDDNTLYRAKIHAATGELLGLDVKMGAPEGIPVKLLAAMQTALAQVPGGTATDVEFESDGGHAYYEIEILLSRQEYKFLIDANSGEIILAEQPRQANIVLAREYREDDDDFLDDRDDDDDFFDNNGFFDNGDKDDMDNDDRDDSEYRDEIDYDDNNDDDDSNDSNDSNDNDDDD